MLFAVGMKTIAIASRTLVVVGPSSATVRMARMSVGKAISTSMPRWAYRSVRPPA